MASFAKSAKRTWSRCIAPERARGYRITEINVQTEQGVLAAVVCVAHEKRAGLQPLDW